MTTVIIGQRGVGKTHLLKRFHRYLGAGGTPCLDLDQEIEKEEKKSIADIFLAVGEAEFREIEKRVFAEILRRHQDVYISVGAGFPVGILSEEAKVLWVQRPTDKMGRIFLDRPRLNSELSPIQEFEKRANSRELHFNNVYDQIYILPEGLTELDPLEEDILVKKKRPLSGAITLTGELFLKKTRWQSFVETYRSRGIEFFEIRDDLLNFDLQQTCLGSLFSEKFIYSFRNGKVEDYPTSSQIIFYDWALELGPIPEPVRFLKQRLMVSLHDFQSDETFEQAIHRLESFSDRCVHLKFSPIVENYEDLLTGYLWQQADAKNRSFLPRSPAGRWAWFRMWMKGRQEINFWREGVGTSADQPTIYEWQSTPTTQSTFAAILGQPVVQSWTPIEQKAFFAERNQPVFRIDIDKKEWNRALKTLTILGLRQAAVTSPLKEEAFHSCQVRSDEANEFRSVNTMFFDTAKKLWTGHNTDVDGFRQLAQDLKEIPTIAIWGGGATLKMIKSILPQAISFSSSRGSVREEDQHRWSSDYSPEVVIWAAPRKEKLQWPVSTWRPRLVVDLNYTENSPGREYALLNQISYRSGLKMFQVQAQLQRDFWEGHR